MSEPALMQARPGELLLRCPPSADVHDAVGAEQGLRWIRYGTLGLAEGESYAALSDDDEVVLVILGGRCDVQAGDSRWTAVGARKDVFSGPPHAVFVPPQTAFAVTAAGGSVEVSVCRVAARAERVGSGPRLICPDEMHHEWRGANHWRRQIVDVVDEGFGADRIIVVEVMTPPGHWSSFPPHRHEVDDPPAEVLMEEIYYYRLDNPAGFGLQAVYTDDREIDDAYIVRDHDTLVIPRGYHPVAAAPSSSLYYLCVLAGDRRIMAPRDEPANAWFRVAERLLA